MAITKDELQETLEELKKYRGKATELITVYIPEDYDVNAVQRQLEAEKSTAKNIKSTQTRKNVTEALEKIVRHLKEFKKTPENGLAIFSGDISKVEGQSDLRIWSIEPPNPLKVRLYRCDKEFVLEPLEEQLEANEIYGLLVMDRKEATIGMLIGKRIEIIRKMTSGIPSKVRAGGQCLSPDTLIMKDNGEIIRIDESHNPLLILSENFNTEKTEETPLIAKWENQRELFKIITKYPKFEIKSSKEHTFFVRTDNGLEEKPLSKIKEGEYLVMPEKIDLNLKYQKIEFVPEIKQSWNIKKINIPKILNEELAKLFGYYLGDGNYEIDRISFSEQRKEVADFYCNLIEKCFNIQPTLKFREKKGYYQIRVGSRILSQLFKLIFNEKNKTLNQGIPLIILRSPDSILASFVAGFFDAEGYISGRVAFGINNELLVRQLQFALLRLGIISSVNEYDNRKNPYSNKIRYTLAIDDLESLNKFKKLVGFCSFEKQQKVENFIKKRSNRNKVRQLIVNGEEVARIIRNSGLNTRQFNCPDFFNNKKQLSKEIFKKNILNKIKNEELRKRLEMFYNSNLIVVKINKIESLGIKKTIDIETKNHNFLANGIVVHNSSQRFHRITEGLTRDFYKRIASEMKDEFFENKKLKGILIGGPIPTKDEFIDGEYLPTKLQEKVVGRIDVGDSDESGIKELVKKSQDILAKQEIIYEKKLMEKFFETLGEKPEMVAYKEPEIKKAIQYGAVDLLLLSKDLDKNLSFELKRLAEGISSKVEIISTETDEGKQFKNLSGMGAILRFKV